MKVLLNFLITGWTIFVHCRHLQRIILLDVFCSDPFQIEYSQLSAVAQFKFFQDGAQVIADRAFAEMVSPGNLPVAQPLGHKLNDALLPFADAVFSKVTLPAAFQQPGSLVTMVSPKTLWPWWTAFRAGMMLSKSCFRM